MKIPGSIPCTLLLALSARMAEASPPDSSSAIRASLLVRSDVDSAIVLLDGHAAGRTPIRIDTVTPGTHVLKVIHPDITSWLAGVREDTITIAAGEHRACVIPVQRTLTFPEVPPGHNPSSVDSRAGTPPLILKSPGEALQSTILAPRSNASRLILTGAAMTATGILTAYLKIKADNRQDLYLQTGDPALLAERNRLDRGAAATLILTQIGFGLFVYDLLSQ